jgi:hypothetical protein
VELISACSTITPPGCLPDEKYQTVARLFEHGTVIVQVGALSDVLAAVPSGSDTAYVATAEDRHRRCRCCILISTTPRGAEEVEVKFMDVFFSNPDRSVVERRLAAFLAVWRPADSREYRSEVMPATATATSEILSYTIHRRTYDVSRDFTWVDNEWTGHLHLFSYDNPTAQD